MSRKREHGSAMLVTMIIIAALLAGGAMLASIQTSSMRSAELTRNGLASLYCAEAALTASRSAVIANSGAWNATLAANCNDADSDCKTFSAEPSWMSTVNHDIDGNSTPDFVVSIRDNDDENGAQDYETDADETVFIIAKCTRYPDTPRTVEELIYYKAALNPHCEQEGGCNSRDNSNDVPP
jgi:hypothetical protein